MKSKIENLRESLKERYLSANEYTKESFEFAKTIFIKEKKWIIYIIIFILLNIYTFMNIIKNRNISVYMFGNNPNDFVSQIVVFITNIIQIFFLKNIIDKIYGKSNISKTKTLSKCLIWAMLEGLYIILFMIFGQLLFYIVFFFILYFKQVYLTKDINLIEAFKYNLYISKENRLRIIVPYMIFGCLGIGIFFVLFIMYRIFSIIPITSNLAGNIIVVLVSIAQTFLVIIKNILIAIVYLNVEYMDFKKNNKNRIDDIILEDNNDINNNK